MEDIESYFLNEKAIIGSVAKGLKVTTAKEEHIDAFSKSLIEKEIEPPIEHVKANKRSKREKQLIILDNCTSFESVFKINNDTQFSHLIRISPATAIQLQKILLAKQLQGQKVPLNNFIDNILQEYLIENEKEIRVLEKPLFSK